MRTSSTQWDGDPWEQSKKHGTEKEIMKKNVQISQDLSVCGHVIPDLSKTTCCNCDPGEQYMVLYHVKEEIMKQDWRFCNMKVYALSKRDLYSYAEVKNFLEGGCS